MGKTVVLISSKGGSGKSTVAAGISAAFSLAGKKILLIDADEGARCLDAMLSADREIVFDLADILNGNAATEDVVRTVPFLPGISLIPSPLDANPIPFELLCDYVRSQTERYDYIIVDTKGQLSADRLRLLPGEAEYISVVTTDNIAVKNTAMISTVLKQCGINNRLIINRFKSKGAGAKTVNIDGIIDTCGAELLGIVPEDRQIGLMGRGPLVFGKATKAIYRIASRMDGNNVPLPDINKIL